MALVATVGDLWQDNGTSAVQKGDIVQIIDRQTYEEIEPDYLDQSELCQKIVDRIFEVQEVIKHDDTLFAYRSTDLNGNTVEFFDWEIDLLYRPDGSDHIETINVDGKDYKVFIKYSYTDTMGETFTETTGMLLGSPFSFLIKKEKPVKELVEEL